jgi:hypothetical protein
MNIDLVYDIETYDLSAYSGGPKTFNDTFICGGVWSDRDGYKHFHLWEENDMADYILSHGGNAFAHSGGTFDHLWLIDNLLKRGILQTKIDLFASGSRLVTGRLFQTALYDSWAIAPMSLEKLTKGLAVHKEKLDLPCRCGETCGGYCSIRPDMPWNEYARLTQYLAADVASLHFALSKLFDFASKHGIEIKATIGSTAWAYARKVCKLDVATWDKRDYSYIRAAYNGGFTKAIRHVRDVSATMADINSSYPNVMATEPMPYGDYQYVVGSLASKVFASGAEGIVRALVSVPPSVFLPSLPYRRPGGSPVYPTGTFLGSFTAVALRQAIERGDAILQGIESGLFWNETAILYRPFVDTMYRIRRAEIDTSPEGKDSALGTWAKLVANSLSGKLGVRPEKKRYVINGLVRACSCRQTSCVCGSATPVSDYVVESNVYRIDPCAHVHHAAYITSIATQHLLNAAKSVGHEHVYYFDTDSIFASRDGRFDRLVIGNELGQWSSKDIRDLSVYGSKLYQYSNEKGRTVKAKGARRPTSAEPGTVTTIRSVTGLKKTLSGGFRATVFDRALRETWGDRVSIDGIHTRPKRIEEA